MDFHGRVCCLLTSLRAILMGNLHLYVNNCLIFKWGSSELIRNVLYMLHYVTRD